MNVRTPLCHTFIYQGVRPLFGKQSDPAVKVPQHQQYRSKSFVTSDWLPQGSHSEQGLESVSSKEQLKNCGWQLLFKRQRYDLNYSKVHNQIETEVKQKKNEPFQNQQIHFHSLLLSFLYVYFICFFCCSIILQLHLFFLSPSSTFLLVFPPVFCLYFSCLLCPFILD